MLVSETCGEVEDSAIVGDATWLAGAIALGLIDDGGHASVHVEPSFQVAESDHVCGADPASVMVGAPTALPGEIAAGTTRAGMEDPRAGIPIAAAPPKLAGRSEGWPIGKTSGMPTADAGGSVTGAKTGRTRAARLGVPTNDTPPIACTSTEAATPRPTRGTPTTAAPPKDAGRSEGWSIGNTDGMLTVDVTGTADGASAMRIAALMPGDPTMVPAPNGGRPIRAGAARPMAGAATLADDTMPAGETSPLMKAGGQGSGVIVTRQPKAVTTAGRSRRAAVSASITTPGERR